MIAKKYWLAYYQDNLVLRVMIDDNGGRKIISQRKRLPAKAGDNLKELQKQYLVGTIQAVKYLRDTMQLSIGSAINILNVVKGTTEYRWTHLR
ncbi:MAG: hypothetical protein ACTSQY_11110 [Candidatus Odinarchaeia archaeon]